MSATIGNSRFACIGEIAMQDAAARTRASEERLRRAMEGRRILQRPISCRGIIDPWTLDTT